MHMALGMRQTHRKVPYIAKDLGEEADEDVLVCSEILPQL